MAAPDPPTPNYQPHPTAGHPMTPPRALRRAAFVAFAILLFTATHWPNLAIESDVGRPDLVIHAATFAIWTALLIGAAFFGPALAPRNILAAAPVAALYAGLDEGLQAIPALHRTAAWDDLAADLLGVALATLGALALAAVLRRRAAEPR